MKLALCSLLIFGGSFASAELNIQGSWKFVRGECSSGAKFNMMSGTEGLSGTVDALMIFTKDQIQSDISIKAKLDPVIAAKNLTMMRDALSNYDQTNPGAASKDVQELKETIAQVQKLAAGLDCKSTETVPYTLSGSTLYTKAATKTTSTCDAGATTGNDKDESAQVEITGNQMKVSNNYGVTDDDASCPKGDREITYLTRVK